MIYDTCAKMVNTNKYNLYELLNKIFKGEIGINQILLPERMHIKKYIKKYYNMNL